MSWRLDIRADGADDQLTAGQAAALKAAVITALAGISHTTVQFATDAPALKGLTGGLEPPMASVISRQAADSVHTATRN